MASVVAVLLSWTVATAFVMPAQDGDSASAIVTAVNSRPGATVTLRLPPRLSQRLASKADLPDTGVAATQVDADGNGDIQPAGSSTAQGRPRATQGWRIQVYSDSNQRTARTEARKRANAVASHFPDLKTYVVFVSPYWRARVGDFTSRAKADDYLRQMRTLMPFYGKEMRVVRDRVTP